MNKSISGLLLLAFLGTVSQADILQVEAGAGMWNQEPSGYLQYQNAPSFNEKDVGYTDEDQLYVWVNLKHPVPVLPNIRLEYAPMEFSGTSTANFEYAGQNFTPGAVSTLTLDQYDAVLYYNILDNTAWTTLDLGLDIKYIDTDFKASQLGVSVSESEDLVLPMLYGRLRFEVPGTELGLEGDVKYTPYKDSKVYDCRIKADYSFDLTLIDLGIEAGYRFMRINVEQKDFSSLDTTGDIEISGFYAGAMIRF